MFVSGALRCLLGGVGVSAEKVGEGAFGAPIGGLSAVQALFPARTARCGPGRSVVRIQGPRRGAGFVGGRLGPSVGRLGAGRLLWVLLASRWWQTEFVELTRQPRRRIDCLRGPVPQVAAQLLPVPAGREVLGHQPLALDSSLVAQELARLEPRVLGQQRSCLLALFGFLALLVLLL